ncbi:MAG: FAD-dependent oxidoreductase [Actinobacteria bacterium]|nr:FAD-dependent oxidoreductase [Actinomycetota bacterium]
MHVVIIGSSAAGLSALEAFRRRDNSSPVTVVSAEAGRPYSRVLLPYYLRGRILHEGLFIRPEDCYERLDARTVFGEFVERVDAEEREVILRDGRAIAYDRLLVAAGSRPSAPPIEGLEGPGVQGFWTLDDAARLDRDLRPGVRLMVLGAGFVALQAAWAAHRRGAAVTVVELEGRILPRVLDEEAARLLRRRIEAVGVQIATSVCIAGVERACGELCCTAAGADTYEADIVIVATGVLPNDGLLAEAVSTRGPGLEVAATMETAVADVFAAGDVARAPMWGGAAGVLALWPVAVAQGRVAGANLAGAGLDYEGGLSANVTEMFGVTVASVGRFEQAPGEDAVILYDLPGVDYLKLVVAEGVPKGAVYLGGQQAVRLLGRLVPYIRYCRPLDDPRAFFEERRLAGMASVTPWLAPAADLDTANGSIACAS